MWVCGAVKTLSLLLPDLQLLPTLTLTSSTSYQLYNVCLTRTGRSSLCVRKVLVSLTRYDILQAQDTELLRTWFSRLMKHVQYDLTGEVTQTQCLPSVVQFQPIIAKRREDTTSVKTRIRLAEKMCAPHLEQQSLNNIFNLINNNSKKV
jgi:hypothetical protein